MTRFRVAAAIIAVQLIVPAALLIARAGDPLPRAFGWQMYSAHGDRYAAWLIDADEAETPIDVDALLLRPRAELRLEAALVAYLCERNTEASAVRVQLGPASSTTACR